MREEIKHIKGQLKNRMDDGHWLHYYHKDDPRQKTTGFPDSPHHTGIMASALYEIDEMDPELHKRLQKGYKLRVTTNGLIRHIRTRDPWNRDQFTMAIHFLKKNVGIHTAKLHYAVLKTKLKLKKNHTVFIERVLEVKPKWSWVGDLWEIGDTWLDVFSEKYLIPFTSWARAEFQWTGKEWFYRKILHNLPGRNGVDSSVIKNFWRMYYQVKYNRGTLTEYNWKLINRKFDVNEVFTRYFTFKHNSIDRPPPVHLLMPYVWKTLPEELWPERIRGE